MSYNSEQIRNAVKATETTTAETLQVVRDLRFTIHWELAMAKVYEFLTEPSGVPTLPAKCPYCQMVFSDNGGVYLELVNALDHIVEHIFREYGLPNVTLRPTVRLMILAKLRYADPEPEAKASPMLGRRHSPR